jgi:hypothetical protein
MALFSEGCEQNELGAPAGSRIKPQSWSDAST